MKPLTLSTFMQRVTHGMKWHFNIYPGNQNLPLCDHVPYSNRDSADGGVNNYFRRNYPRPLYRIVVTMK